MAPTSAASRPLSARRDPDVPLAVVMLPPASGTSKTYDQARRVFTALDVQPVSEPELDDWAEDIAQSIVGAASGSLV